MADSKVIKVVKSSQLLSNLSTMKDEVRDRTIFVQVSSECHSWSDVEIVALFSEFGRVEEVKLLSTGNHFHSQIRYQTEYDRECACYYYQDGWLVHQNCCEIQVYRAEDIVCVNAQRIDNIQAANVISANSKMLNSTGLLEETLMNKEVVSQAEESTQLLPEDSLDFVAHYVLDQMPKKEPNSAHDSSGLAALKVFEEMPGSTVNGELILVDEIAKKNEEPLDDILECVICFDPGGLMAMNAHRSLVAWAGISFSHFIMTTENSIKELKSQSLKMNSVSEQKEASVISSRNGIINLPNHTSAQEDTVTNNLRLLCFDPGGRALSFTVYMIILLLRRVTDLRCIVEQSELQKVPLTALKCVKILIAKMKHQLLKFRHQYVFIMAEILGDASMYAQWVASLLLAKFWRTYIYGLVFDPGGEGCIWLYPLDTLDWCCNVMEFGDVLKFMKACFLASSGHHNDLTLQFSDYGITWKYLAAPCSFSYYFPILCRILLKSFRRIWDSCAAKDVLARFKERWGWFENIEHTEGYSNATYAEIQLLSELDMLHALLENGLEKSHTNEDFYMSCSATITYTKTTFSPWGECVQQLHDLWDDKFSKTSCLYKSEQLLSLLVIGSYDLSFCLFAAKWFRLIYDLTRIKEIKLLCNGMPFIIFYEITWIVCQYQGYKLEWIELKRNYQFWALTLVIKRYFVRGESQGALGFTAVQLLASIYDLPLDILGTPDTHRHGAFHMVYGSVVIFVFDPGGACSIASLLQSLNGLLMCSVLLLQASLMNASCSNSSILKAH